MYISTTPAVAIQVEKDLRPTVWNKALFLNKLEDTRVASTMTTTSSGRCTVQDVLDAQVDFVSGCITSNFDAITQRREGPVRPAASTVL